jgi:hypothetical protein
MTKRTIEIDDCLEEQTQSAIEDVKQALLDYLEANPDTDETPDIGNDLDYSGTIHEIVDGAVPIYTSDIEAAWYLYGSELEEAYENAGVGDNPRENNGMAAIYYYIDEKVREWYNDNAEDIFDEWKEKRIIHTSCQFCEQDIEGSVSEGDWRDRGNNPTCPTPEGDAGRKHEPVDE